MWYLLDIALIAIVVLLCSCYVIYSLSSIHIKRVLLSWLVRIFGIRVFSVLSPRISGCDNCSAGTPAAEVLQKLKKLK
jgi:hypothetical protein